MDKFPLLILGSSGHAKVIIDIVEKQGIYNIVGLIDSFKPIGVDTFGYKNMGTEDQIQMIGSKFENLHLFIAIGDNAIRQKVYKNLVQSGMNFPYATLIHPNSIIGKNVKIGVGTVVMAGAIINPDTFLGDFVIINTSSSVDHDCYIGDFATIAPGAVLGGSVLVGKLSVVSLGASVKHGVTIGEDSIVGAGAVVINSIPDNEIHVGVPAKKLRSRNHGDRYL